MKQNEPLRGPKYRSRRFQEYLLQQPPERRAEILSREAEYNELRSEVGGIAAAAEYTLQETLRGAEDTPAGATRARVVD